jgi:carboxypeptidase Q
MSTLNRALFTSLLCLGSLPLGGQISMPSVQEDGTSAGLVKAVGEGLFDSGAYACLAELTDTVGGRVTGSPAAQKAIEWAVNQMKMNGLTNVHKEPWTLFRGWTRGTATAEMIEPLQRKLYIDSLGWVGSTPADGVDAEVVAVNLLNIESETPHIERFRGKVVLVEAPDAPPKNIWVIFSRYSSFVIALERAGAVALIGGQGGFKSQGMHLTHTGSLIFAREASLPIVSIAAEDQGQIERLLAAGRTVRIHINVQNSFTTGSVPTGNIVGEILGREEPEQIVVLGAHLDSWDLSEGATDNGTNVCSVLAAARALVKSGSRPRRTIRFVLFMGEEQGELGSAAYIHQHSTELPNHIAAVVSDSGQGPISEAHLGRTDVVTSFEPFAKSLENLVSLKVNDRAEFGTDTGPFVLAGLPGINLEQDSPDYRYTIHSAADALEAAKPEVLERNATIMAATAYWLANRSERFASPWPTAKTAAMLREQDQYERLKALDMWPFGDLGRTEEQKPN